VLIGLLEDDTSQIELISLWANESGNELKAYTTSSAFREALASESFDIIVLDWQLPDTSGLDELDWLRQNKQSEVPVIFITSRDSEESVIEALDHGADDYMVKPVKKGITLSRINALQRRSSINRHSYSDNDDTSHKEDEPELYKPYEINAAEGTISKDGEAIKLTNKEFELAAYLFRNTGSLVSRDYLLENIWDTRSDLNTRTVDTHISRIRSKLGINPSNGWQLSSIYQRGYRLFQVTKESA
jgi:DNA-binding response OmpR family regulator